MTNKPIQHLVPLEVSDNFEEENDFQIKNGSAKRMTDVREEQQNKTPT